MPRLEEDRPRNASLDRRRLLALAGVAGLSACGPAPLMTASQTPALDVGGFVAAVGRIRQRIGAARLGVGLMNLDSGETAEADGDARFPMQSVFKLPVAAAALAEVDAGRLLLSERFYLLEENLSPQHSPIASQWPGRREYAYGELLKAMLLTSDNTAADVLMKRIGGPGAVTAWLSAKHVTEVRIDRYERELQPEVYGMPSFRRSWRDPARFAAARQAVPPARRLAAMQAYMADPRDTATPRGMLRLLQALNGEQLISPAATRTLLELMGRTTGAPGRIRAGLPPGTFLAHRSGSSGVDQGLSAAHNDVGIFVLPDRRAYALAVFLSASSLDEPGRDAVIADVARAAVKAVR